jgi:hypothetical protein
MDKSIKEVLKENKNKNDICILSGVSIYFLLTEVIEKVKKILKK